MDGAASLFKCAISSQCSGKSEQFLSDNSAPKCVPIAESRSVVEGSAEHGVDYSRFCEFSCRIVSEVVYTPCTDMTFEEQQAASTSGGNGKDLGLGPDRQLLVPAPEVTTTTTTTTTPAREPGPEKAAFEAAAAAIDDAMEGANDSARPCNLGVNNLPSPATIDASHWSKIDVSVLKP